MIGTSEVLQEEFCEHYTLPEAKIFREDKKEELLGFTDLELTIADNETGKPISKAMISIDTQGRTAVCDGQGKVIIQKVLSGSFILDVIVPGYAANSSMIQISIQHHNNLTIKMIRNS